MTTPERDYKALLGNVWKGLDGASYLDDAIMDRISAVAAHKKVQHKKENRIVRICVLTLALTLTAFWFVFRGPKDSLAFSVDLDAVATANTEVMRYVQMAILVFILALLFLGLHRFKVRPGI
ncbi:hypothetical protein [Flavihumibacter solisilvae]|uniref:Uncharacterized protein n=1 Tax=Flavihumibacter solisilvae TaxID=1349421 RepID=A0A0C1IJY6_9BACT|nr:hypothetical protein [Flavihumibacter solisilvae]KIC90759.1 hypothetical protein OI18_23005 [Flavihumibacter solisilvae]